MPSTLPWQNIALPSISALPIHSSYYSTIAMDYTIYFGSDTILQLAALLLLITLYTKLRQKPPIPPDGLKLIPTVPFALPFFGHALHYNYDMVGFMKKNYHRFGPVFRIRMFQRSMVIVCDPSLVKEYFRNPRNKLAFEEYVTDVNLRWAHFEHEAGFSQGEHLFRTASMMKPDALQRAVESVASSCDSFAKKCSGNKVEVKVQSELYEWTVRASYASNVGGNYVFSENTYNELRGLYKFVSLVIGSAFIFPRWIAKPLLNWKLCSLRRGMKQPLLKVVQSYRLDSDLQESNLIRSAISNSMSDSDIADSLLMGIGFGSVNVTYGLAHALGYLALPSNAGVLQELMEECKDLLADHTLMLKAPLLESCILEGTRLSTQILAIQRKPLGGATLGDYYIPPDVDYVTLAAHILQVEASNYKEAGNYNPHRFMGKDREPATVQHIVTWGGGVSKCPGKPLSLALMKIVLAHIVVRFEFELVGGLGDLSYATTDSYAERRIQMRFWNRQVL